MAVLLGGKATFTVNESTFEKVGGRRNVFNGKPHSVDIPAGAEYSIQVEGAVEVALPSATSNDATIKPYVINPSQVANSVWG